MEVKSHPVSDGAITGRFPEYINTVLNRLKAGADAYGDESFKRPGNKLCEEMAQEALDIAGWGFILWCRIKDLEQKLKDAEERSEEVSRLSRFSRLLNLSLQRLKSFVSPSSKP